MERKLVTHGTLRESQRNQLSGKVSTFPGRMSIEASTVHCPSWSHRRTPAATLLVRYILRLILQSFDSQLSSWLCAPRVWRPWLNSQGSPAGIRSLRTWVSGYTRPYTSYWELINAVLISLYQSVEVEFASGWRGVLTPQSSCSWVSALELDLNEFPQRWFLPVGGCGLP